LKCSLTQAMRWVSLG